MKRSFKLISVVLAAAMVLSVVSCAKRRTGAERIKSDSYAKPEAGLETDYTEPTETETAPTDTMPTDTDPVPETSATPAATGNGTPTGTSEEAYTASYLYISGILFTGADLNTTKMFVESSFNVKIGDPVSTDKSTTSPSYTVYTYECNIVIDGVEFNNLEIDVCDSTGVVFQTSFINNKENGTTLKSYQKQFADKLSTLFGTALTDKSSGEFTNQVYTLDGGLSMESGCLIDGTNNMFWVSFNNESLLT